MSNERYRVWADIEAPTSEDAEHLLRDTLDKRPAIVYGATGKTEHNGWKNYETWAVKLWIDNEQDTSKRARTMARQALANANDRPALHEQVGIERGSSARYLLADDLKSWITETCLPDLGASLASDLLNAAVSEVDFNEIAASLIEEVREP